MLEEVGAAGWRRAKVEKWDKWDSIINEIIKNYLKDSAQISPSLESPQF